MAAKGIQWDDSRAFSNPYDDYKPTKSESQITTDYAQSLKSSIDKELKYLHSRYVAEQDQDKSLYTGAAGGCTASLSSFSLSEF
jgi:hypothetical protein